LQNRPNLTPDQVKKALTATAIHLPAASSRAQGSGLVNLASAKTYSSILSGQLHVPATGLGSLQLARGSNIISSAGTGLVGDRDIFGAPWLVSTILTLGDNLLGGLFNGGLWTGVGYVTDPVLGLVWNTSVWGRTDWAGSHWTDDSWTGSHWTGSHWTGSHWTGSHWTGSHWTGDTWSSASWGS
jgi:serine protease AprX